MEQIFINLPVKNTAAAVHFYTELGCIPNPLFTFENQKCMTWGAHIYIMLQTHEMFFSNTTETLSNKKTHPQVTFTLPVDTIEMMHLSIEKALKAGGKEIFPAITETFMQGRNIEDENGHRWCILYLDIEKFKESTGK